MLLVAALAVALGACSDEGDPATDTTVPAATTDPLDAVAEPGPGEGIVVLDGQELTFAVTECAEGPAEDDTPEAQRESALIGSGTSDDGDFSVIVSRYRSDTGQGTPVVTETAQIAFGEGDAAVGVEAKRTTAGPGGEWLDLTDPTATRPLITRVGDAVDVRATFGPAGARAEDEGLFSGRLRARCPA